MLLKRVLSAVVGIPLIIMMIYYDKWLFLSGMLLLTWIGLYELKRIFLRMNLKLCDYLIYGSGMIFPLLAYYSPSGLQHVAFYLGLTLVLVAHLLFLLLNFPRYSVGEMASSYLGICYISLLFSYLILIRKMDGGFNYLLFVLILTWSGDIGAYAIGRLLGRHPLWPKLSPHKTWEGSFGGALSSLLAALAFNYFTPGLFRLQDLLILGLVIGVVVQLGDLVESAFKRLGCVKDSGEIIPGHGGVLDRFDSLLFSAPTAYFYFKILLFH